MAGCNTPPHWLSHTWLAVTHRLIGWVTRGWLCVMLPEGGSITASNDKQCSLVVGYHRLSMQLNVCESPLICMNPGPAVSVVFALLRSGRAPSFLLSSTYSSSSVADASTPTSPDTKLSRYAMITWPKCRFLTWLATS